MSEYSEKHGHNKNLDNNVTVQSNSEQSTEDLENELKQSLDETSKLLDNLIEEITASLQDESLNEAIENINNIEKLLSKFKNKDTTYHKVENSEEE
jgi:ribosome-associated translation inhibitor RaiA